MSVHLLYYLGNLCQYIFLDCWIFSEKSLGSVLKKPKQAERNKADAVDTVSPRYKTIYSDIMKQIKEGVYPVGSLLPPEIELCRQFDASRHTIRLNTQNLFDKRNRVILVPLNKLNKWVIHW